MRSHEEGVPSAPDVLKKKGRDRGRAAQYGAERKVEEGCDGCPLGRENGGVVGGFKSPGVPTLVVDGPASLT